jgi:carbamoyltransferase
MKQLLAVILHFLPLLVISSTPIHIDVTIDKTTYLVSIDPTRQSPEAIIFNFCQERGLIEVTEVRTGASCESSLLGTYKVEFDKAKLGDLRTAGIRNNVSSFLVQPPLTTFPNHITEKNIKARVERAQQLVPSGIKARLLVSVYAFGHDAHLVSMCDGHVLGVIELERLPGGKRYFDLVQEAMKVNDDAARDQFCIDLLSRALSALWEITDTEGIIQCHGQEVGKFDAGVIVDPQTPAFLIQLIKKVIPIVETGAWVIVNHHDSHALLGWYDSPFYHQQTKNHGITLILSYDGFGNDGSFVFYTATAAATAATRPRRTTSKFMSLGQTYLIVANLLEHFWTVEEKDSMVAKDGPCAYEVNPACQLRLPGILMAYAALGKARTEWRDGMRQLLIEGRYDKILMPKLQQSSEGQIHLLLDLDERGQRDFAATAQSTFEEIVMEEISQEIARVEKTAVGGTDKSSSSSSSSSSTCSSSTVTSLILVGGCALNVRTNTVVQERFRLPVYVPSSPSDCGIAIGGGWTVSPPLRRQENSPAMMVQQRLEYLGAPLWDTNEVDELVRAWLQSNGAVHSAVNPDMVASLLVEGKIGAIVRGRQEVGPRALGHRSLVGVPNTKMVCGKMNRIKHRDWYRPCAPVLVEEEIEEIFEVTKRGGASLTSSPYMSFAPRLQPWVIEQFPGIAHVDGTARPQTVSNRRNAWLHSLLLKVGMKTGASILINTSFNTHGRPILNSAKEALSLLRETKELDFVVINDWLFTL